MKLALGIRLVDVADAEGRQQLGTEHDFRAANGAHRTAALGACTGMVPRLRIVSGGGHENAVEEPSDFGDLAQLEAWQKSRKDTLDEIDTS
jgi:hypothetical protein